jgi:hypothetical protein
MPSSLVVSANPPRSAEASVSVGKTAATAAEQSFRVLAYAIARIAIEGRRRYASSKVDRSGLSAQIDLEGCLDACTSSKPNSPGAADYFDESG